LAATAPQLSLVLACYREAEHLAVSVPRIFAVLEASGLDYEVIFIDDCSPDHTPELLRQMEGRYPRARFYYHEANVGRGGTVSEGLRLARGTYAGFIDIDLEVAPYYIPEMVRVLQAGADVALGQRHYNVSLSAAVRFLFSKGYVWLRDRALRCRVEDTETGYKFFCREKILPVLEQVQDRHWFWDTEIVVRAERAGLQIVEVPVLFLRRQDKTSTVRLLHDSLDYLSQLRRLARQLRAEEREAAS
jgi:hypothetical protein